MGGFGGKKGKRGWRNYTIILKEKKWKENQVFRRHTNDEVSAMKKILYDVYLFST